ncbi:PP2C family protein-serine/threonine phosphatase [Streptomyces halobius]|uniref:Protein phosphatase 2C domain-containing protein n=1 Tax=Streptomyces halobius TaxID=2879846 RepID=A0ABY4M960_9ACTN|nr:PP2C family serine/threonine-protein phosphatase [Streptomyces halobius]UQA94311.1 protein phosphatase 2C domain-containing protein [Streptomyces halobius]
MSLSLRFAAGSHKGMIREGNEDSGYAGPRLLAVADGMGGQAAGEVASSEVISSLVQLDDDVPGSDILTSLGSAVQRANEQLRVMVEEDAQLEGMGTTLTALLWTGQRLGLVHVGDSRAYLLRDGVLTQITQDHTWVQRLVDEGRITEEEATTHPQRSLLMRALGSGDHVEPDLSIREVRAGDRYLICSDGLSGVVSHQTLEETLAGYHGPHETIQELIQLALRGGGPDNITCIVADVLDVDANDTMTGQLNDTPVIVGAVAENQHQLNDPSTLQTPAARAAELGRRDQPPAPPGGAFGPPGSGGPEVGGPQGSFGAFMDEDFIKPKRGRWIKRSLLIALVLAVVGGGLYAGYRWTQTQYFVGAKDNHVALYRGLSQDLAWISLSDVDEDHPEIELKYLPPYQRNQVKETIAVDSRARAGEKVIELGKQASACRILEQRQAAERDAAREKGEGQAGGTTGTPAGKPGAPSGKPSSSATAGTLAASPSATPAPTTGQAPTEEQRKLEKNCSTQQ